MIGWMCPEDRMPTTSDYGPAGMVLICLRDGEIVPGWPESRRKSSWWRFVRRRGGVMWADHDRVAFWRPFPECREVARWEDD